MYYDKAGWKIYDWAGNDICPNIYFLTFDDGWEFILGELTDNLGLEEENYQEYQVIDRRYVIEL
jgi:hypothetical protein